MLINGCKTIVIRCRFCGRLRKYSLNIFNIMANSGIKYKCKCGETNIFIRKGNKNSLRIEIACFSCGDKHFYKVNLDEMFKERNMLYCIYGPELCFLGSGKKANQILLEKQISLGKSENATYGDSYFNNFKILGKALKQLHGLNKEQKIDCDCGKSEIDIQLFPDRLELRCSNCHSVKIIFAETEEDLSILMKKDKIILKEHNISCIDSIKEKNKDIKE